MKQWFKEFKAFIAKGNVIDLAVALMIGSAFQKIVSSLVNQIFMPIIAWMVKTDLSQWYVTLQEGIAMIEEESTLLNPPSGWVQAPIRIFYGPFIQSMIDFLIIALVLFFVVKLVTWTEKIRLSMQQEVKKAFNKTKKPTKS